MKGSLLTDLREKNLSMGFAWEGTSFDTFRLFTPVKVRNIEGGTSTKPTILELKIEMLMG